MLLTTEWEARITLGLYYLICSTPIVIVERAQCLSKKILLSSAHIDVIMNQLLRLLQNG